MTMTTETKELTQWEEALRAAEEEQAEQTKELNSGSRISFSGGVITVDGVVAPPTGITGIIIAWRFEHAYYKGKYNPEKSVPPTCWALGTSVAMMEPDERSIDMQAEVCEICPKFEWGSDPMGGRGKACKTRIRLAFYADGGLKLATLPVTSTKSFTTFMSDLLLNHGFKSAFRAYAKITISPNAKTQYTVNVKYDSTVPSEKLQEVSAVLEKANDLVMTPWELREDD